MDDIAAFLNGRLDEDEAVAKAAAREYVSPWGVDKLWRITGLSDDIRPHDTVRAADNGVVAHPVMDVAATHIAHHDPARVLAEVAAKRAIVDRHDPDTENNCSTCVVGIHMSEGWVMYDEWPCWHLRTLAAVYADHADYRDEWRL